MVQYKRRRGGKKYGRKRKLKMPKLTPLAIAKATQGARLYNYENRATGHQSAVNQIMMDAGYGHDSYFDNSVPNQVRILDAVGIDALGDSAGGGAGIKYHISKHNVTHTLRNLTKEPAIVTCYVFKNLVDITYQDLTVDQDSLQKAFMSDLVKGWDLFQTAGNVNLAGTGTQVIYAQSDQFCKLTTDNLWPTNSIALKTRWKMLKKATKRMLPGDDWILPVHLPNVIYDPVEKQQDVGVKGAGLYVSPVGYLVACANEGRVFVIRLHGEIGVSDADANVYGWMSTNIYHGYKESAQVRKLQTIGNSVYMASTKDTDAADLMTPSQFHMVKQIDDGAIDDL